jgi:hypothetical protein
VLRSKRCPGTGTGVELELELIMRRVFASALFAGLIATTFGATAAEAQTPAVTSDHPVVAHESVSNTAAPAATPLTPKADVSPVAVTAKRAHSHLQLKLSSDSLSRVLTDSGVEPVAESETAVETVEVTARRVQMEPIAQGIPALYYGIMHPSEAWRIFAPIQP